MYRTKIAIAAVLISLSAVLLAWAAANPDEAKNGNARGPGFAIHGNPRHHHLERARKSFDGDLRKLEVERDKTVDAYYAQLYPELLPRMMSNPSVVFESCASRASVLSLNRLVNSRRATDGVAGISSSIDPVDLAA